MGHESASTSFYPFGARADADQGQKSCRYSASHHSGSSARRRPTPPAVSPFSILYLIFTLWPKPQGSVQKKRPGRNIARSFQGRILVASKTGVLASKSGRRDSNPRRPAWEAGILPLNYSRGSFWPFLYCFGRSCLESEKSCNGLRHGVWHSRRSKYTLSKIQLQTR